ncbi:MAG TPA: hypothetical protein VHA30_00440 [Patescibacteria group bacterium]|nr:hypothetical protein [Patescibacteria group bacterium]
MKKLFACLAAMLLLLILVTKFANQIDALQLDERRLALISAVILLLLAYWVINDCLAKRAYKKFFQKLPSEQVEDEELEHRLLGLAQDYNEANWGKTKLELKRQSAQLPWEKYAVELESIEISMDVALQRVRTALWAAQYFGRLSDCKLDDYILETFVV